MKPESTSSFTRAPGDSGQLDTASHEWLSALVDGQAQALEPACAQWRDDPQARRAWRDYHLIGDVMRSDELARQPGRDADFMAGLRARLAQEPVVLAPPAADPVAARPAASRPAWTVPVAVAAGFVVVAGVLIVARMGPVAAPSSAVEMATASGSLQADRQLRAVSETQALIVDPRLEEFLRVHQASGGGMSGVTPGGALRRVDIVVPVQAGR